MRIVTLKECADINPRTKLLIPDDKLVSFLPMSGIDAETGTTTLGEDRSYSAVKKGYTPFLMDDSLIAKITPCFENGKIAQAQIRHSMGFGSTEFHVIRAHPDKLHPRYLHHFLRQPYILTEGEKRMTGSAGQKRVPASFFADLNILLPTLQEQERIASILDKAESLRAKRREAITLINSLTQSIFLEMFGAPVTNPKNEKIVRLKEITTRITDGVHQKPNYTESGVPFISVKDITTGNLIFDNCKYISAEDHQKYTKRCKPEYLDILYTKVGATYGRPAIVNSHKEFSIYVSVCLIKPNKEIVDPYFLNAAMGTSAIKSQADRRIKGIGVPDLHLDQIQNFLLPLPSMERQREFAERVNKVTAHLNISNTSNAALDSLFASIQQIAFKGDL